VTRTVRNVLTTLEATQVEPGIYDQKTYAPGNRLVNGEFTIAAA
jgi:hypothetical protein